jgi:hypothetical protein
VGKRWWSVVAALVVGVVAVGCAAQPRPAARLSEAAPTTTSAEHPLPVAPHAAEVPEPDLSAAVARAVEAAGGVDLGVSVLDLDTGAAAGLGADTPFRSASLSKLLVAVDLLTSGEVPQDDRERLERALSLSDDDAMNDLWDLHDGLGAIDRVAARAGLTATRAPEDATQWGDVEMSAEDVTKLYRYVERDLPEADRDFVVTALSDASPTAADGFDQAYGLLAPGVDAFAKQGWMWYLPDDLYLHTAGVVADRYAVAVLSVQTDVTEQDARDLLTGVTDVLIASLSVRAG